jgi:hypothetical protein
VQRPEALGHGVHHQVDLVRPPGQRPGQHAGYAEHLPGVGQPHREHGGAGRAQRADGVRDRGRDQGGVEVRPQRVVDPGHHAGDVRPQPQGSRQLIALHVSDAGAVTRQVVQLRFGQALGQQRGPAAPAATSWPARCPGAAGRAGRSYRITDAEGDRVAQGDEPGHAGTSARSPAAAPSTAR